MSLKPSMSLAALSLIVTSSSAFAGCTTSHFIFNPSINQNVDAYSQTDNGRCGYAFRVPGRGALNGVSIVAAPRSGRIMQPGQNRFVYAAAPGFTGKDHFAARVCGSVLGKNGCSTISYTIAVQR